MNQGGGQKGKGKGKSKRRWSGHFKREGLLPLNAYPLRTTSPKTIPLCAEKQRPKKKRRFFFVEASAPPPTHLGSIRREEFRSCNWVVAITGKKIHPGPTF
jgi:hypothetical protein